jgi:hypothetical protein
VFDTLTKEILLVPMLLKMLGCGCLVNYLVFIMLDSKAAHVFIEVLNGWWALFIAINYCKTAA